MGRILHIELQSDNDPRIHWRCLAYYAAIREMWPDAKVTQVVVYVGDSTMTMSSSVEDERLNFGFDIINIKSIPASRFLSSPNEGERMLAMLAASEDSRSTIRSILESWSGLPRKTLRRLVEQLAVLSQLRNCDRIVKEERDRMPIHIDITQNAFYKEGEEHGEARGALQGALQGKAEVITRVLEARFGPLSRTVKARIAKADLEQLDRWSDLVATAPTLEAVFR